MKKGSFIALVLLFSQAIAVNGWSQTLTPKTHQQRKTIGKPAIHETLGLTGCVKDYATRQSLAGMAVQVSGTDIKAITNKAGNFYLPLPDSFQATTFMLTANYTRLSAPQLVGTMLMDEEVNRKSEKVVIYRYPVSDIGWVTVTAYKETLIDVHWRDTSLPKKIKDR